MLHAVRAAGCMSLRRIELEVELIEWVRFLRIALGRTSPMGAATKACGHRGGSVWGRLYREDGTLAGARWVRWVLRPACPGSPLPLASTAWSFTGLTGYLAKDGSGFAGRATKKVGCSRPMTSALPRHPAVWDQITGREQTTFQTAGGQWPGEAVLLIARPHYGRDWAGCQLAYT